MKSVLWRPDPVLTCPGNDNEQYLWKGIWRNEERSVTYALVRWSTIMSDGTGYKWIADLLWNPTESPIDWIQWANMSDVNLMLSRGENDWYPLNVIEPQDGRQYLLRLDDGCVVAAFNKPMVGWTMDGTHGLPSLPVAIKRIAE